jgi:hypothetical protein
MEGGETWRVLRARFPGSIATHSALQNFFFGDDLLLSTARRERVIDQDDVAAIHRHRRGSRTLYSSICGSSQPSCPKTFIPRG